MFFSFLHTSLESTPLHKQSDIKFNNQEEKQLKLHNMLEGVTQWSPLVILSIEKHDI